MKRLPSSPQAQGSVAMHFVVGVAGTIMLSLLLIPLIALLVRALADPRQPLALLDPAVLSAVRISLLTTGISMICVILLGTPLAYAFATTSPSNGSSTSWWNCRLCCRRWWPVWPS
jgi:molybdate transport system permease protein